MTILVDRRDAMRSLAALGAAGSLPLLGACESGDGAGAGAGTDAGTQDANASPPPEYSYTGELGPETLFVHGVASGDPLADRVILWTRVSLPAAELGGPAVQVFYEVARDEAFADRVAAGEVTADAEHDWTCKVDAAGLKAATTYWFRFRFRGRSTVIGRTRTAAATGGERLQLGVASCASFGSGYFTGYGHLAKRLDLDAILHLGDYIYEYGGNPDAERYAAPPHECKTVQDYRTRYAAHRGDADLQEAHRVHPFVCVWDDHETVNNAWNGGAPSHNEAEDGPWPTRRDAAWRAWRDWLPARIAEPGKIWRKLTFGGLCDLWMLDTRIWGRSKQTTPSKAAERADPDRGFLGPDQEAWLLDGLATTTAKWQVLGQQVMFAPLSLNGTPINTDQWDGYKATRERVLAAARAAKLPGFVILTGDIHTSWANDIVEDSKDAASYDPKTGKGAIGAEFVVPGITSGGFGNLGPEIGGLAKQYNPHIRWNDLLHRGYGVLDLRPDRAEFRWWLLQGIDKRGLPESLGAAFAVKHGAPGLTKLES